MALEASECPEDEFSAGGGGIDLFGDRCERHSPDFEVTDELDEMGNFAAEPVGSVESVSTSPGRRVSSSSVNAARVVDPLAVSVKMRSQPKRSERRSADRGSVPRSKP